MAQEMHTESLAYADAGMNRQAALLLKAMSGEEIDLPNGFFITTHPYSNGREMGFCLSLFRSVKLEPVNFAFFEHRNSDEICVIRWEGRLPIHGGVTVKDIPEKSYPDKWTVTQRFKWMQIREAILWTIDAIKESAAVKAEPA